MSQSDQPKDFKLTMALSSAVVKRDSGVLAKSFHFHAEEMKEYKLESAELSKDGTLNIIVIKE